MNDLKSSVKNKFKNISIYTVVSVLGKAWIRIFPLVAILMIITSIIIIFNVWNTSIYNSDLSDKEMSTKVALERKKNDFQKNKFDNILKSVKEKENEFKKNIKDIDDMFYTSNILERMKEQKKENE